MANSTGHRIQNYDPTSSCSDIFRDEDEDTRERFQNILYRSPGAKEFFDLPPRLEGGVTMGLSFCRSQSFHQSLLSPVGKVLKELSMNTGDFTASGAAMPPPRRTMTPDRFPKPRGPIRVDRGSFGQSPPPQNLMKPPELTPEPPEVRGHPTEGRPPNLPPIDGVRSETRGGSVDQSHGVGGATESESVPQEPLDVVEDDRNISHRSDEGQPETPQNSTSPPSETVMDRWYLTQPSKRIIVIEGHRQGDPEQDFWHSSAISKRLSPRLLVTTSGSKYRLQGKMNVEMTLEQGFSSDVVQKFLNGFPADWKEIIQEQCIKNEAMKSKEDKETGEKKGREKVSEEQPPSKSKTAPEETPTTTKKKKKKPSKGNGARPEKAIKTPVGRNVVVATPKFKTPLLIPIDEVQCSRSGRRILPPLAYWTGERQLYDVRLNKVEVIAGRADETTVAINTRKLTGLKVDEDLAPKSTISSRIRKRHQAKSTPLSDTMTSSRSKASKETNHGGKTKRGGRRKEGAKRDQAPSTTKSKKGRKTAASGKSSRDEQGSVEQNRREPRAISKTKDKVAKDQTKKKSSIATNTGQTRSLGRERRLDDDPEVDVGEVFEIEDSPMCPDVGKNNSGDTRESAPARGGKSKGRKELIENDSEVGVDEVFEIEDSPMCPDVWKKNSGDTRKVNPARDEKSKGRKELIENDSKVSGDEISEIEDSPMCPDVGKNNSGDTRKCIPARSGKSKSRKELIENNSEVSGDELFEIGDNLNSPKSISRKGVSSGKQQQTMAGAGRPSRLSRMEQGIYDEEFQRRKAETNHGDFPSKTSHGRSLRSRGKEVSYKEPETTPNEEREDQEESHRTRNGKSWSKKEDVDLGMHERELSKANSANSRSQRPHNRRENAVELTPEEGRSSQDDGIAKRVRSRERTRSREQNNNVSQVGASAGATTIRRSSRKPKLADESRVHTNGCQEVLGSRRLPRQARGGHKQIMRDERRRVEEKPDEEVEGLKRSSRTRKRTHKDAGDTELQDEDVLQKRTKRTTRSRSRQDEVQGEPAREEASGLRNDGTGGVIDRFLGQESESKAQSSDTESVKQAKDDRRSQAENAVSDRRGNPSFDIYGDIMGVLSRQKQRRESEKSQRRLSFRSQKDGPGDDGGVDLTGLTTEDTDRGPSPPRSVLSTGKNGLKASIRITPLTVSGLKKIIGRSGKRSPANPLTGSFQTSPQACSQVAATDGDRQDRDGVGNTRAAKDSLVDETKVGDTVEKKGELKGLTSCSNVNRGKLRTIPAERKDRGTELNSTSQNSEEKRLDSTTARSKNNGPVQQSAAGKATTGKSSKAAKTTGKGAISLNAKKGTLKRKRQLRELAEHHNMGFEEDMLDATPYRKPKKNKILYSDDSEDEEEVDAHILAGKTPSLGMPNVKPVSSKKTPHPNWTPGLLQSVNRDKTEQYIFRMQKRSKLAKQKTTPLVARTSSKLGTKYNKFQSRMNVREVDKAFKVTDIPNSTDSDEDRDYYWSDEEAEV